MRMIRWISTGCSELSDERFCICLQTLNTHDSSVRIGHDNTGPGGYDNGMSGVFRAILLISTAFLLSGTGLSGCDDETIRVYHVDGDSNEISHHDAMSTTPDRIAWELPAGWQVGDSLHPFRYATLYAGYDHDELIEIAVSSLSGDGGGLSANVNRWRGQMGREPLTDDEIHQQVKLLSETTLPAWLVEISDSHGGMTEQHMIIAVITGPDSTWFVKARATQVVINRHRDDFISFVRSIRMTGEGE